MIGPDYDELEKVKYHSLERMPRTEYGGAQLLLPLVSIGAAAVLGFIAYLVPRWGLDPLLVSTVVGLGIVIGLVVTAFFVVLSRLEWLTRHLITIHEELLYARTDIRDRQ
jgi:hypothetical protein